MNSRLGDIEPLSDLQDRIMETSQSEHQRKNKQTNKKQFKGSLCNIKYINIPVIGEGNGTPLQYSWLKNPTDGRAWRATVHAVAKSQTGLSDLTFTFHFHALKEEMATHSSVLAWRIPGTGEPGGISSMNEVTQSWT